MLLRLVIPGVPVPAPRPNATVVAGRPQVYMPKSRKGSDGKRASNGTAEFKALVRLVASQAYQGVPLAGPIRLDSVFVFPRQSSHTWKTRPMLRYPHTARPDIDNLWKLLADSLTGILWVDDDQVCEGWNAKVYAAGDEQPHTEINVTSLKME